MLGVTDVAVYTVSSGGYYLRQKVRMGALASESLDGAAMKALTEYSEAIGLAFQIHDDILDVTSSTEILGKTAHSDENLEKSTFPALLGLDGAKDYERKVYEKAVSALAPLKGDTSLLREFAEYIVTRGY